MEGVVDVAAGMPFRFGFLVADRQIQVHEFILERGCFAACFFCVVAVDVYCYAVAGTHPGKAKGKALSSR